MRLQGSISLFPVDDIIVFLQPLTHVAFICFISRHEHTGWKLCLIAKLKTFGFPFLSALAGTLHSLLGWFLGGGGGSLGFSQPPYLTQQSVASWLVARGPSVARGKRPVVGIGRPGSRSPSRRRHCVSSSGPPQPVRLEDGQVDSPRLAVPLSFLWPRQSEQGGDHVSLDPRTRGTNRPGCLGMGADGPPLARPGMAGGRWKQASRIWLELGLTQISKPDRGPSPFPGLGRPCLLTLSAEGASLEGGRPPGQG